MLISDIKLGTDDSDEESDKENQLYKYLKLCLDKRRRKIKVEVCAKECSCIQCGQ